MPLENKHLKVAVLLALVGIAAGRATVLGYEPPCSFQYEGAALVGDVQTHWSITAHNADLVVTAPGVAFAAAFLNRLTFGENEAPCPLILDECSYSSYAVGTTVPPDTYVSRLEDRICPILPTCPLAPPFEGRPRAYAYASLEATSLATCGQSYVGESEVRCESYVGHYPLIKLGTQVGDLIVLATGSATARSTIQIRVDACDGEGYAEVDFTQLVAVGGVADVCAGLPYAGTLPNDRGIFGFARFRIPATGTFPGATGAFGQGLVSGGGYAGFGSGVPSTTVQLPTGATYTLTFDSQVRVASLIDPDGDGSLCVSDRVAVWNALGKTYNDDGYNIFLDLNLDGVIDSSDYAIVASALFASGACIADLNCDGVVDGSDWTDFVNAFALGDPLADVGSTSGPSDGTIDGSDFIAFVNAFSLGC